ncbi:hypothetical protein H920_18932 [Fukomys damarensis]|uniref:Uncharacterized protein n=1 Tax=Fukomys damarensis TaxID=885580 RepID=A0A091D9X4_FUKDA|nr:hypothetical protein H920_18932 [Fukomys damarensis]
MQCGPEDVFVVWDVHLLSARIRTQWAVLECENRCLTSDNDGLKLGVVVMLVVKLSWEPEAARPLDAHRGSSAKA